MKKPKINEDLMVNVHDILEPKEVIKKQVKIGYVKQFYVNIPKEIAEVLKIQKGDALEFTVIIPKNNWSQIKKEFRIIHKSKSLFDKREETKSRLESIDISKGYDGYDKSILRTLLLAKRELTTLKICEKTGMHWSTVKRHLTELETKRRVISRRLKNRTYWKIIS